jgi:hypothetical protein
MEIGRTMFTWNINLEDIYYFTFNINQGMLGYGNKCSAARIVKATVPLAYLAKRILKVVECLKKIKNVLLKQSSNNHE